MSNQPEEEIACQGLWGLTNNTVPILQSPAYLHTCGGFKRAKWSLGNHSSSASQWVNPRRAYTGIHSSVRQSPFLHVFNPFSDCFKVKIGYICTVLMLL